jgi:hypothetical protein
VHITLLGLVLVPLALVWSVNPLRLLQLTLLFGIFEAAAALVLGGSFGLQPAMVPGLAFVGYIFVQYALGMRYPGEGQVLRTMLPLLGLCLYALLSIYILPDGFAGRIMVWPQRTDALAPGFVPLQFTFGNVTQTLYLVVDVTFALFAAVFVTRRSVQYYRIVDAYIVGGYIVVMLVFWQLANRVAHVPFPDIVLYSNPSWVIVRQSLGSVPRMQGPFTEPSALAFYLCGIMFCCLWLVADGCRRLRPGLLLGLSIACILLSTSTTGICVVVVALVAMPVAVAVRHGRRSIARLGRILGLLAVGCVLVTGPILVLKPDLVGAAGTVLQSTLAKGDSESYEERSGLDVAALGTVTDTFGLGVGWGSFRSSSLVPGLLANSGVFGVLMVAWFLGNVLLLGRRARARTPRHSGRQLVAAFSASLCGQVGAALLSAPMISSLIFYLQLGCVVGVSAQMAGRALPQARPPPLGTDPGMVLGSPYEAD